MPVPGLQSGRNHRPPDIVPKPCRVLHQQQAARERGVPIITFNPLRERGLEKFTNFITPRSLSEDPDVPHCREGVLTLITVRSNDQFNTTVYGYDDRLRGINGTRMVILMNTEDMAERQIDDGVDVDLISAAGDNVKRVVRGLRAVAYNVPRGSCAGYCPECNPLLPLWHYAERSKVPAAKSIPVRVVKRDTAAL